MSVSKSDRVELLTIKGCRRKDGGWTIEAPVIEPGIAAVLTEQEGVELMQAAGERLTERAATHGERKAAAGAVPQGGMLVTGETDSGEDFGRDG